MFETTTESIIRVLSDPITGSPAPQSLFNDPQITKQIYEDQVHATQVAILTGIGAALLSRVVSHVLVYSGENYKETHGAYSAVLNRQRQLVKLNSTEELFGREATPSKAEFQANHSQSILLKKEVFRAKAPAVAMTVGIMIIFGHYINSLFPETRVAKFPCFSEDNSACSAAFLYALTFLVFEKMLSKALGQRVRGLVSMWTTPLPTRFVDAEFPLLKLVSGIFNIIFCYKLLKKFHRFRFLVSITRVQSRITGYICKLYIPVCFRRPMLGLFSAVYGVKIEEATRDRFEMYTTFTDFFTRTLKPTARPIQKEDDPTSICSPCDGRVLTAGKVSSIDSTIDCVKGRSYRLDEFLLGHIGEETHPTDKTSKCANPANNASVQAMLDSVAAKGNELHYMVIYLSPGDYHRFHSPAIHTGRFRRHIAGYLSPVKPSYVNKHRDVFKNNERVNIFGDWKDTKDFFFTSFVGALNVGSILLDFDNDVTTNRAFPRDPYHHDKSYSAGQTAPLSNFKEDGSTDEGSVQFAKGEMTGRFEMGSTIVLIYETNAAKTETLISEGDVVTLGQPIVLTE